MRVGDRFLRDPYEWEILAVHKDQIRYVRTGGMFSPMQGCVRETAFRNIIDGAVLVRGTDVRDETP